MPESKIAIISPEEAPYSATFIQAHIDLLHADVFHLYGIFFPKRSTDGTYVLKDEETVRKVFGKLRLQTVYKRWFDEPVLEGYFRQNNIQLVLAEFGPVGAEVYRVCKKLNIPLIVHFHGYDAYAYSIFEKYGKAYEQMFEYAHSIIVVSQDMRRAIIKAGCTEEKIVLNPYGPRDEFFELQPTFDKLNFVAVGRFVDKKAPHLTLKAFHMLQREVPEARLIIAGDGPLFKDCQQMVKELEIESAVTFLGAVSHEQILKLYQSAYCFIQHSVVAPNGDSEGTPVAIIEACAASLPVVATRHAGIKDAIVEEQIGLLVDEEDVEGMANAMIRLAKDKTLASEMGKMARKRMQEHYTMDRHIGLLKTLIHKCIIDEEK